MFQSRKQDYFNWKTEAIINSIGPTIDTSFSPASRIILIESFKNLDFGNNPKCFSPASRIILIESWKVS